MVQFGALSAHNWTKFWTRCRPFGIAEWFNKNQVEFTNQPGSRSLIVEGPNASITAWSNSWSKPSGNGSG
jgi:hypothetical protein